MGFASLKVHHIHPNRHTRRAATPNASCQTGGFYQSPTNQQTVDALQPLEIKWDTTCLDTQKADIYLYAPTADNSRVAVWQNADFTTGSVTVDLMPRWWNSTDSMNLQLAIVKAGQAPFLSPLPAGPIFSATYAKPNDGSIPDAADTTIRASPIMNMDHPDNQSQGLSGGKIAAAVIMPLLVAAVCIYGCIRWQRKKSAQKSKRFSVAVDKRMSTISTDWKSVTAAGANAAIRNSMAVGNRSSSFSFGAIRPASTFGGDEAGRAGVGAGQMGQTGTGVGLRYPNASALSLASNGERVSRVSFAEGTRQSRISFAESSRPSIDSRRPRFYQNEYVPPVPSLPPKTFIASPTSASDAPSEDGTLSPRQAQGPLTLTPEDIRARIAAGRSRSASSATSPPVPSQKNSEEMDDVFPALTMMRTDQSDELLLPTPPPAAHSTLPVTSTVQAPQRVMSPVIGAMPMSMPVPVMSPDEMLRAYAERRRTGASVGGSGSPVSYPMSPPPPAATPMSPTMGGGGGSTRSLTGGVSTGREGVGRYGGAKYEIGEDEDAYGGMH